MNFKIAVVGTGAIGTYYGGKLAAAGRDVHFLVRSGFQTIRRRGLWIYGKNEKIHVPKVNCYRSPNEIGPCDLVFVSVKTTANQDLPDLIRPLLHDQTMLLTLQNGLGNEEFLAQHFGAQRILGGLCFICLGRAFPGIVHHYDKGHITIGEFASGLTPRLIEIASEFKRGRIKCNLAENLMLQRWRKLIWNIPFNGLSVLAGGIDTAAILKDDNLRQLTRELMDETILAANKCGYPLENAAARELIENTYTMGAYKPSTLLDFEAGKPLEVEAIWGEPFRRATAVAAAVPRLQMLYSILRMLDAGRCEKNKPRSATSLKRRKSSVRRVKR